MRGSLAVWTTSRRCSAKNIRAWLKGAKGTAQEILDRALHPFLVTGFQPHALVDAEPGMFPGADVLRHITEGEAASELIVSAVTGRKRRLKTRHGLPIISGRGVPVTLEEVKAALSDD